MARTRSRTQPRAWHFWRKAFWTRPILLVLYGLMAGALGTVMLLGVVGGVQDAVAMRDAAECPPSPARAEAGVDPPRSCRERVPVILSGPWYSRGPGSDWHLLVERDGRRMFYAEADVPPVGSRRLADGTGAEAVLWEGEPILIEVPDGTVIETDSWGDRGWLIWLFAGMFATSGLPMLLTAARFKRQTTDSWWSVRGEPAGLALMELTAPMQVACLLAIPSMLGLPPLAFGLRVRWAVVLAIAGLALVLFAIVKHRGRRDRAGGGGPGSRSRRSR